MHRRNEWLTRRKKLVAVASFRQGNVEETLERADDVWQAEENEDVSIG